MSAQETSPGERAERRQAFLAEAGWGAAERRLLAADASFRHYDRLTGRDGTAVLMDAPPDKEPVTPFLTVAATLQELGLSAPRILAADAKQGFVLLEDFGDRTFTQVLAAGGDEPALYRLALDLLVALQKRWTPELGEGLKPYDMETLLAEARLLVDWFLPAITGRPTDPEVSRRYLEAWRESLAEVAAVREVMVLRDYHVDNLMLLPGRPGPVPAGCSTSRTRCWALPPTTWCRCWRTPAATWDRDWPKRCCSAGKRPCPSATRRPTGATMPASVRSVAPRSRASSPGWTGAMASPATWPSCRAC